jgi:hypothetical protein
MDLLAAQAGKAGVRQWCRAGPGYDANLIYCGRDHVSQRHLFALDMTQKDRAAPEWPLFWSGRSFDLTFDPSLTGDAELISFTDHFESCNGGEASYNARSRILSIRFHLPAKLSIKLGAKKSGADTATTRTSRGQ